MKKDEKKIEKETEEKVFEESAKAETEEVKAESTESAENPAQKLADEYKDKWMRSVAEFDNYKKRTAKVYQEAFSDGASSVILKILSVGDNLDLALTMELDEKTAEGVRLIKKKFEQTLKELEVEEINPAGETFDPNIAEAVMQVEGGEGEKSETVKQVFLKGYKLKDKVIRYAKVSVVK